ncbi:DNA polymerase III subunit gamma and tau [Corynebacterium tapiri]|uniref:DNA polymerase III subunit gamma/tau n=1 Tax=Corynebacterium tapiri TaxID=1448266 RepID=A0A5C4U3P4_9CORY|nr:DNA polymerase III subunit gamma and tau [Corynebacterium tapiri]TNL97386.1 DNA polymerase III subunit gamma and tau [Corynebacterium tapiri]
MALYRKYRPSTFGEVVGQEQVTVPLSKALDAGRINHAYLFSGPRGCGKTSSARILARSLNCVHGPTSTPCGKCESCVALAPGGPGNLDVMELDAASHNGVEDMRELRDRAIYAPAESRYRVFIIDEAHMITNAGSNALLKVVEEPPEHLIFIFATTEPEKVIGTIRSRTHHYPFRLVSPPDMQGLMERIVAEEGVQVEPAVYPLAIEAGGGSPRDTLSILDQLLAGAGEGGLTYAQALPLLGATDLSLLDAAVTALADSNAADLFRVVGQVVDSGHEPRRFAQDLLARLRDLMVIQAVPTAIDQGLVAAPTDRAELLQGQAGQFTGDSVARLASTVNQALDDMKGPTSQRLLLEIACARMLVDSSPAPAPVAETSRDAAAAAAAAKLAATRSAPKAPQAAQSPATKQEPQAAEPKEQPRPSAPQRPEPQRPEPQRPDPKAEEPKTERPKVDTPQPNEAAAQKPEPKAEEPAQPETQQSESTGQAGEEIVEKLRADWAQIRQEVGKHNRIAEIMLTEARVLGIKDDTLVLGHNTGALAQRINAGSNNSAIAQVVSSRTQRQLKVTCVVGTDPSAAGFSAAAAPKTWNPQANQRQARTEQSGEATESSREDDQPHPAEEPRGWKRPAAIPDQEAAPAPSAEPTPPPRPHTRPEPAPAQQPRQTPDWRQAAQRAAQQAAQRSERDSAMSFSNGVPLPPEPGPEEEWEPDPASLPPSAPPAARPAAAPTAPPAPSRDEEEQMMADEAREPGTRDHRDATQVAVDLLQTELGARRA